MNGKDLFLGMNYVKAKFIEEAETVTELKGERKTIPFRKVMLIAAAIALLAITITACAYAIQRIKMNLVQHNVPVQTETVAVAVGETQVHVRNLLTDYYPQTLPEDYEILSGSPTTHNARGITYGNSDGKTIQFQISSVPREHDIALRPPVEESTVTLSCGEATIMKNEGAQVLLWNDENEGYDASLFTDDLAVDLISMAESMGYGAPIPLSVWYHMGQEWDPWYPQSLPEGYTCKDVSPIGNGYQNFTYENGNDGYIRYGISTVNDLMPTEISEQGYWEEVEVNGTPARIKRNQSTQQTIFWYNDSEGFYAFLETIDASVDLVALAESVGPGPKMEVSKDYFTRYSGNTYVDFWETMEYCLLDANGDGIEDLILGRDGNVNAIWTMKDGKTAGLDGTWAQGYLCEGYIFEWAVLEDGSHYHSYRNLMTGEGLGEVSYYPSDGIWRYQKGNEVEELTEEEAFEIINSYVHIELTEMKPVKDYPMN